MAAQTEQPRRLAYVDGLRALAALYVVMSHLNPTYAQSVPSEPPALLAWLNAFTYGHAAVSVFIVISGFSLALPVARAGWRIPGGTWRFYGRRARRIIPPYYIALTLSVALGVTALSERHQAWLELAQPAILHAILLHLTLVQDFSLPYDLPTINRVFWSIALECQIYVLFPALLLLWRRYHPAFAAGATLIASLILLLALVPTWIGRLPGYGVDTVDPLYIGLFGLGMLAAWLTQQTLGQRAIRAYATLSIGGLLIIVIAMALGVTPIVLIDPLIGITMVGVLLIPPRVGTLRAALEWRPLVWIGGFSYSLYLIHVLALQFVWRYGIQPLHLTSSAAYLVYPAYLGAGLLTSILTGWGFSRLFERPFMSQRIQRRPDGSVLKEAR